MCIVKIARVCGVLPIKPIKRMYSPSLTGLELKPKTQECTHKETHNLIIIASLNHLIQTSK